MYPTLLIYLFINDHLSCFHCLATIDSAITNIYIQVSMWIYAFISLGYIPRSGIAR